MKTDKKEIKVEVRMTKDMYAKLCRMSLKYRCKETEMIRKLINSVKE